jgi:diguanylate cyclase (GGDEF)-like protein
MQKRRLIVVASMLLVVQGLTIACLHGTHAAAILSDLVQIGLGVTCLSASLRARASSGRASSYHWTWLAVSFAAFILAQTFATYIDLSSDSSWDRLGDILFSLPAIPMAMLPFVDPDREHSRFDRLHVLDFVQVSCFWLTVYLYFRNTPRLSLASVGWEGFGWSSALVCHAILTLSFVLGAALGRSKAAFSFFGGMAAYVFLAGLADSYADLPSNNVHAGQWFDLVWSSLQAIPLLVALTWKQNASLAALPARAERVVLSHLFPLLYAFFAVLLLVRNAGHNPVLSSLVVITVFGALAVRILVAQHRLLRAQDTLAYEASHDALTGTYNRAAILETLSKELLRQNRSHDTVTVMLADIDHFKSVNDTYGHIIGDQVLTEVAQRLTASLRSCDSVGRYGGEEFLIILPECNTNGASTAGERLRSCIADAAVSTTAGSIPVSVSIGLVSACPTNPPASQTILLRMADEALYQAKAKGRNRVEPAKVAGGAAREGVPDRSHAQAASR